MAVDKGKLSCFVMYVHEGVNYQSLPLLSRIMMLT